MVPLLQENRGVRGVKGEWEGVIWHPHMEILTTKMVVPPTMVAVGVCVSNKGMEDMDEKGGLVRLCKF